MATLKPVDSSDQCTSAFLTVTSHMLVLCHSGEEVVDDLWGLDRAVAFADLVIFHFSSFIFFIPSLHYVLGCKSMIQVTIEYEEGVSCADCPSHPYRSSFLWASGWLRLRSVVGEPGSWLTL